MKKIGFIDYFLDEWHANNYPLWIKDSRYGNRLQVFGAWAMQDKTGGLTTRQWCEKFGVQAMPSQEALIEACDCLVILSPDNPEYHEELSKLALQSGKPTYIDKTFATSYGSARRMFDLAAQYQTPMYSTSSLRYARELEWFAKEGISRSEVSFVSARGPGVFLNYSIHQLEMIVTVMGPGACRALALNNSSAPVVVYEYADGRSCVLNHLAWSGFSLAAQTKDGRGCALDMTTDFWPPFIDALLNFFETGKPAVLQDDTCAAIAMYEAGLAACKAPGQWIKIPG
ncbi:MAG: Gfo/Idh/MocA family oxidoreductase [Clostridiaceae bacterium]|nr:Gfo/Idh/MocA family oxidoreductase [Clostridiaceae bacterium]